MLPALPARPGRATILTTLVTSLVAALAVGLTPGVAMADPHPTAPGLVDPDPINVTPNVLDGHVDAFAQVGDTMIVGGSFSQVEHDGVTYHRDNVFAFSAATGDLVPGFHASANGEVFDLQVTPDQHSILLVGAFSSVDGAPNTAKAVEVAVADGSIDHTFTSPAPNGLIRDVVAANGFFYVAGAFTSVGGHPRSYVAALNPDGSDSGTVALAIEGTNAGGSTNVRSMDVTPDGATLALAGNFATIDGHPRGQLALVDVSSTGSSLSAWSTERFAGPCGPHFDSYMRDVAFSPDGDFFVVAATGGPSGRQETHRLCDSISRWDVSTDSDVEPAWVDYTGGDTLTAAIVDEDAVYVGGHQRWMNNSYGHNDAQAGAVAREGIAALDPANGLPYSWNPGRRRGYGVYGFALTANGLWVGHDTKGFGGELRQRLAFCPRVGGEVLPTYETAALPGRLALLQSSGQVRVRSFDGHQASPVATLPSGQQWGDLRGAFIVDDVLYAGWSDGTMTAQPFDGTSVGTPEPVDLHGAFPDLATVRAMFFDRATHRIYYSVVGRKVLFYRYFQPESRLVGSWRYPGHAVDGMPMGRVGGAFLVGRKLFLTDTKTGNLTRVRWDSAAGSSVGVPRAVLGPSIDGHDYSKAAVVALS